MLYVSKEAFFFVCLIILLFWSAVNLRGRCELSDRLSTKPPDVLTADRVGMSAC